MGFQSQYLIQKKRVFRIKNIFYNYIRKKKSGLKSKTQQGNYVSLSFACFASLLIPFLVSVATQPPRLFKRKEVLEMKEERFKITIYADGKTLEVLDLISD